MEKLTLEQVKTIIRTMADTAIENEKRFSDLDGVMGDADFGTSIAGGYRAVLKEWEGYDYSSIGSFLINVAKTWTGNTGGCSGPVWGTLFMRCGLAFRGKTEVGIDEAIPALKNAMDGIMQRGGAKLGDKTMLDALDAIVKSFEASVAADEPLADTLSKAADAAYEMRESTKDWVAMRGRQSFTGDRSRGTYDPGIVAVGDFAKAIVAALS